MQRSLQCSLPALNRTGEPAVGTVTCAPYVHRTNFVNAYVAVQNNFGVAALPSRLIPNP